MSIERRLIDEDKQIINPTTTQAVGILLSFLILLMPWVVFEKMIAENFNWFWVWIPRAFVVYFFGFFLALKFFRAGLEDVMQIGFVGIPRFFGKPIANFVYLTGRHWTIPGKGNGMQKVDMRSQTLKLSVSVTTKDLVKMMSTLSMQYMVYDPHIHVEVAEFKDNLQSNMGQAFLDISSENKAEEMLLIKKNDILKKIKKHLKKLPLARSFKLQNYGIEIQEDTISVGEGFNFFDDATRKAYELEAREKKELDGEKTEWEGFIERAEYLVIKSENKITFEEAFLRIMQLAGKHVPDEKIIRLADIPDSLKEIILLLKK